MGSGVLLEEGDPTNSVMNPPDTKGLGIIGLRFAGTDDLVAEGLGETGSTSQVAFADLSAVVRKLVGCWNPVIGALAGVGVSPDSKRRIGTRAEGALVDRRAAGPLGIGRARFLFKGREPGPGRTETRTGGVLHGEASSIGDRLRLLCILLIKLQKTKMGDRLTSSET